MQWGGGDEGKKIKLSQTQWDSQTERGWGWFVSESLAEWRQSKMSKIRFGLSVWPCMYLQFSSVRVGCLWSERAGKRERERERSGASLKAPDGRAGLQRRSPASSKTRLSEGCGHCDAMHVGERLRERVCAWKWERQMFAWERVYVLFMRMKTPCYMLSESNAHDINPSFAQEVIVLCVTGGVRCSAVSTWEAAGTCCHASQLSLLPWLTKLYVIYPP